MKRILTAVFVVVLAWQAAADPFHFFEGEWQDSVKVLGPQLDRPENKGKEYYLEWWGIVFRLEKGYWAYVRFEIANLGPGDGKLKIKAQFSTPDGGDYSATRRFSRSGWKTGGKTLISADGNVLSYDGKVFRVKLKNKEFSSVLTFRPLFAPWRPRNGRIVFGDNDFYYAISLPMPLGEVEGTFTMKDGTVHHVRGRATIDHQVTNGGLHKTTKHVWRFRKVGKKAFLLLFSLYPPPQYGSTPATFLLYEGPQGRVEATGVKVTVLKSWQDPQENGYLIPKLVKVTGKERSGGPLKAALKVGRMTDRDDFLKGLNFAERFIVSKFAKPIEYTFDAVFALDARTAKGRVQLKIKGDFYFNGVNH